MDKSRRWFLGMVGGVVGGGVIGGGIMGMPADAAPVPADDAPEPADDRGEGSGHRRRLYIGSYGHDIALATVDPSTGLPAAPGTAATTPDPSYLALSADGRRLYAANELEAGTISAFAVGAGGALTALGARETHGKHPCYVHVHPGGRYVLSANYTSGSVTVHPVRPDGSLGEATDVVQHTGSGPDPDRQQGPHAHKVTTDPAARFVHAVDLGADTVFAYRLRGGKLERVGAARFRPGSGPRHLSFHPSGRVAYVTNELEDTLAICSYDPANGRLTPVRTVKTAPAGNVRNYPSEVVVSADGRFVYVGNRGHNSVAVFAVEGDGLASRGTVPCGGDFPRHIALSGDGRFLYAANQRSGDVATLRVNRQNGALTSAGPVLTTGTPTVVLPA